MATEIFKGYLRLGNFPLDQSSVFPSHAEANNYARNNKTAYVGQLIAVVNAVAEEVSIYKIIFPFNQNATGFELEALASGGGGGTVGFINGLRPDENGDIKITGSEIEISRSDARTVSEVLGIFEGISSDEIEIMFNKVINVHRITGIDTTLIHQPGDAVNLEYLQQTQRTIIKATNRMVKVELTNVGRPIDDIHYDFQNGDIISRIAIKITEAYSPVNISLKIRDVVLVSPEDIFEEEIGTYIVEPSVVVDLPSWLIAQDVEVFIDGYSAKGSATIYIEFTRNPYDSI